MEAAAASTEIWVLGWSAVLLVVQVLAQAATGADKGMGYIMSSRDELRVSKSVLSGRLQRALANLLETYPAFIALAVALALTGKTGGIAATGAIIWLVARILYVLVYAAGVPVIRSFIWFAALIGLAMMALRLLF